MDRSDKNIDNILASARGIGRYFGYPQCCIDEYVRGMALVWEANSSQMHLESQSRLNGNLTGLFPSEMHSEQILKGETLFVDLITNRICSKPFPDHQYYPEACQDELVQMLMNGIIIKNKFHPNDMI
jgi:hypothetical protein